MPPGHKSEASIDLIKFVIEQIQSAQKPVVEQLQQTNVRLGNIEARLLNGDQRLRDHSEFVTMARPVIERVKNKSEAKTPVQKDSIRLHWAVVLILGGALTWVGERGVQVLVNNLAEKPPAAHTP